MPRTATSTASPSATPRRVLNPRGPQVIAYADRISAGDLASLSSVLNDQFQDVFDGVHVLPFFRPYDGADAGFDPEDHAEVDPRLGTWEDVARVAENRRVMADLIVNHISANSDQFQRFVAEGAGSDIAPLFLTLSSIFPGGATEEELAKIHRPGPGLPFTPMTIGGERRLVWTTFTSDQIDLDVRSTQFWNYLTGVIDTLIAAGVSMLRLDAVGYTGKVAGTDCFMTAETVALIERISEYTHRRGAEILLEIHGHYEVQIEIARSVDYVYDFALPPLVLHALHAADPEPLYRWLQVRPANSVNVLDTHDGIGTVDVGPSTSAPSRPGLLDPDQLNRLVESIHVSSGGTSRLASGEAASNLDSDQVNCTFFDALARDEDALLVARLVQLLLPGIPHVYYVGLLAGVNDVARLGKTGIGREVNRPCYDHAALEQAVARPIVARQLAAIRWRSNQPAFGGDFGASIDGSRLGLTWKNGAHEIVATIDFATRSFEISTDGQPTRFIPCDQPDASK